MANPHHNARPHPGHGALPGAQMWVQDLCFFIMLATCLLLSLGILSGHQTRIGQAAMHVFTPQYSHYAGLVILGATLIRGWFYISRLASGKIGAWIMGGILFFTAWMLLSPHTFQPFLNFIYEILGMLLELLNWVIELIGEFF